MARVYGTLTDFGLQALIGRAPKVTFVPSGPGVRARQLFSSTPVEATVLADGSWSVELTPTDGVVPETWYSIRIEHLNPGGEYTHFDVLDWRVYVPADGGPIGGLPGVPLSADTVLVGLSTPPPGYRGWWLYSPAAGEEMPADETGIGDLRRVR